MCWGKTLSTLSVFYCANSLNQARNFKPLPFSQPSPLPLSVKLSPELLKTPMPASDRKTALALKPKKALPVNTNLAVDQLGKLKLEDMEMESEPSPRKASAEETKILNRRGRKAKKNVGSDTIHTKCTYILHIYIHTSVVNEPSSARFIGSVY